MEAIAQFAVSGNIVTTAAPAIVVDVAATGEGKAPRAAYVTISPFQLALFNASYDAAEALNTAVVTQAETMRSLLATQYGATAPTYEQFRADRDALRVLALERGLVDDQWVRKPYNAAVKALYGELPVSMSEAAIAKRASRPSKPSKGNSPKEPKAGKGTPIEQPVSAKESIEQMIARVGIAATLEAVTKILATKRESALDAKTLQAIAGHYKKTA